MGILTMCTMKRIDARTHAINAKLNAKSSNDWNDESLNQKSISIFREEE